MNTNRNQKMNPILRLGLLFLALAGLSRLFLYSNTHLPEAFTHATTGFLYGLTIVFLIFGLARRSQRSNCDTSDGQKV